MHEGRISDRKMGRTGLFSQFFPFQTVDKALLLQGFAIVGTAFLI